jgi:hypothetical protein
MLPNIFTIESGGIIREWTLIANDLMAGWYVMVSVESWDNDGYCEVRATTQEALDRSNTNPNYYGINKVQYFKSLSLAKEHLLSQEIDNE